MDKDSLAEKGKTVRLAALTSASAQRHTGEVLIKCCTSSKLAHWNNRPMCSAQKGPEDAARLVSLAYSHEGVKQRWETTKEVISARQWADAICPKVSPRAHLSTQLDLLADGNLISPESGEQVLATLRKRSKLNSLPSHLSLSLSIALCVSSDWRKGWIIKNEKRLNLSKINGHRRSIDKWG